MKETISRYEVTKSNKRKNDKRKDEKLPLE